MKCRFPLLLALLAAGCGNNSVPTSPPIGEVALIEGPYTLRISPTPPTVCFNFNSGVDTTVQLNVSIGLIPGGWRVSLSDAAAGSLVLTLNREGNQVTGHALGRASAGAIAINLDHPLAGGRGPTANSATGAVTGNVSYEGSAGATACAENTWTLTRGS